MMRYVFLNQGGVFWVFLRESVTTCLSVMICLTVKTHHILWSMCSAVLISSLFVLFEAKEWISTRKVIMGGKILYTVRLLVAISFLFLSAVPFVFPSHSSSLCCVSLSFPGFPSQNDSWNILEDSSLGSFVVTWETLKTLFRCWHTLFCCYLL